MQNSHTGQQRNENKRNGFPLLKSYSPKHPSVSNSLLIENLMEEYKSPEILKSLAQLKLLYAKFRKIRGDGNCFVRAIAFSFLVASQHKDLQAAFPNIQNINFGKVKILREKQIKSRYGEMIERGACRKILEKVWNDDFVPSLQGQNYAQCLAKLINKFEVVDTIIVIYFRMVCHECFQKNKDSYQIFYEGNMAEFKNIEQGIITYGEESQGIMLKAMVDALNCHLQITQVDKSGVNSMDFQPDLPPQGIKRIDLFFRPGHYDILEDAIVASSSKNDPESSVPVLPIPEPFDLEKQINQMEEEHPQEKGCACQGLGHTCYMCNVKNQRLLPDDEWEFQEARSR